MKHFAEADGSSPKEKSRKFLNLADQLKYEKKNGIEHHLLRGKTLGMFLKNRPRVPGFLLKSACMTSAGTRCF